jgi:MFS family permease
MTVPSDHVFAVLARLPRRAKVLLGADAVNAFGAGMTLPFLLIYLSQIRHVDIRVAAAALSVSAFFSFFAGLAWGSLLDRYRHRIVMPAVMLLAGVATALYAVADTAPTAVAVAALTGVAMGGVGPVVRTMFATAVSPSDRTQFFGLQFGLFNAAIGLGILAGGLLVDGSLGRYQLLYLVDGITFVFMAVILLISPGRDGKESAGEDGDDPAAGRPKPSYRSVLGNPVLVLIVVTMTLAATFYYGQFQSVLPGYLTISHAVSPRGISAAFVVNVVVVVLAQFVVMPRLRQVRRTTWLTTSGVLWAVSWLLVLWAGQSDGWTALALLIVSSVPFAVAEVMVTPILAALLNDVAADNIRGRANALFTLSTTAGSIIGPAIAAALLTVEGGIPLVAGLAVGCLLMLIPAALLRRRLGEEMDKPPEAELEPEAASAGSEDRAQSVSG